MYPTNSSLLSSISSDYEKWFEDTREELESQFLGFLPGYIAVLQQRNGLGEDINIDMVMHHLGTLINDRGFSGSALIQELIRITLNEGSISFSNFRPKSSVGMSLTVSGHLHA